MRSSTRIAALAAAVTVSLGVAGCGDAAEPAAQGADEVAAGSSVPAASSSSSSPSGGSAATGAGSGAGTGASAPAFPADAQPDTGEASSGARLTVTDVRVAHQDGFDRVVFQLDGTGAPGWDVRYVDQPADPGSGKAVAVSGDAALQVGITGVGYPYDTGVVEYAASTPVTAPGTTAVTEVVWKATYEGQSLAFVGTSGQRPFRVFALTGPTRLVVDVAEQD